MARNAFLLIIAAALAAETAGSVVGPFTAPFPPPAVNPYYSVQIAIPGFDPALGALRCAEVTVDETWSWTGGQFCVIIVFPGASGTIEAAVGYAASIGRFDATGYVGYAGTSDTQTLSGSCGQDGFCCHPASAGGMSSTDTGVTGYANAFIGTPFASGFYLSRLPVEQQTSPPIPGLIGGPGGGDYSVTGGVTIFYHYTPAHPCPGDVNGDRAIDFLDLNGVLSSYAQAGPCAHGDVNNDGVVDFLDLNEVLSYYGQPCPAE